MVKLEEVSIYKRISVNASNFNYNESFSIYGFSERKQNGKLLKQAKSIRNCNNEIKYYFKNDNFHFVWLKVVDSFVAIK